MTTHSVSPFDVTGWEQTPYDVDEPGPQLFRVSVHKKFRGDLEGESTAQLLMCVADPKDLAAGAGYVVSERVVGRLAGKAGSFVMQHWGLSGGGAPPKTAGHVVPGSGTGALKGLVGTLEIAVDPAGAHTFALDYDFA